MSAFTAHTVPYSQTFILTQIVFGKWFLGQVFHFRKIMNSPTICTFGICLHWLSWMMAFFLVADSISQNGFLHRVDLQSNSIVELREETKCPAAKIMFSCSCIITVLNIR